MRVMSMVLAGMLGWAGAAWAADGPVAEAEKQNEPVVAPEMSDETFDAALEKAMAGPLGETGFQEALRSVAKRFPVVEASTEPGKGTWTELTLNTRGKRVDAIRVRTPAEKPGDLVWAFTLPKSIERWYILPLEGEMQGFRNFWKVKSAELFGAEAPDAEGASIVQALDARNLKPDKEYLLWFVLKDEKPAPMWVTISFLPPGKSNSVKTASKNLGLPRPAPAEAKAGEGKSGDQ